MTGAIRAVEPFLVGSNVYFPCSPPPPDTHVSLFTTPLPTP